MANLPGIANVQDPSSPSTPHDSRSQSENSHRLPDDSSSLSYDVDMTDDEGEASPTKPKRRKPSNRARLSKSSKPSRKEKKEKTQMVLYRPLHQTRPPTFPKARIPADVVPRWSPLNIAINATEVLFRTCMLELPLPRLVGPLPKMAKESLPAPERACLLNQERWEKLRRRDTYVDNNGRRRAFARLEEKKPEQPKRPDYILHRLKDKNLWEYTQGPNATLKVLSSPPDLPVRAVTNNLPYVGPFARMALIATQDSANRDRLICHASFRAYNAQNKMQVDNDLDRSGTAARVHSHKRRFHSYSGQKHLPGSSSLRNEYGAQEKKHTVLITELSGSESESDASIEDDSDIYGDDSEEVGSDQMEADGDDPLWRMRNRPMGRVSADQAGDVNDAFVPSIFGPTIRNKKATDAFVPSIFGPVTEKRKVAGAFVPSISGPAMEESTVEGAFVPSISGPAMGKSAVDVVLFQSISGPAQNKTEAGDETMIPSTPNSNTKHVPNNSTMPSPNINHVSDNPATLPMSHPFSQEISSTNQVPAHPYPPRTPQQFSQDTSSIDHAPANYTTSPVLRQFSQDTSGTYQVPAHPYLSPTSQQFSQDTSITYQVPPHPHPSPTQQFSQDTSSFTYTPANYTTPSISQQFSQDISSASHTLASYTTLPTSQQFSQDTSSFTYAPANYTTPSTSQQFSQDTSSFTYTPANYTTAFTSQQSIQDTSSASHTPANSTTPPTSQPSSQEALHSPQSISNILAVPLGQLYNPLVQGYDPIATSSRKRKREDFDEFDDTRRDGGLTGGLPRKVKHMCKGWVWSRRPLPVFLGKRERDECDIEDEDVNRKVKFACHYQRGGEESDWSSWLLK